MLHYMYINFPMRYRIERVIAFVVQGNVHTSTLPGDTFDKTFLSAIKMRDRMDESAHSSCHRIVAIADECRGGIEECKPYRRATLKALLSGQHQDYMGHASDLKGGAA